MKKNLKVTEDIWHKLQTIKLKEKQKSINDVIANLLKKAIPKR